MENSVLFALKLGVLLQKEAKFWKGSYKLLENEETSGKLTDN